MSEEGQEGRGCYSALLVKYYLSNKIFICRVLGEDVVIQDTLIPSGTNVIMAPCLLHRDPKIFPRPDLFIPERFLPESSARRHPYSYLPFSAGPRNCIGQK